MFDNGDHRAEIAQRLSDTLQRAERAHVVARNLYDRNFILWPVAAVIWIWARIQDGNAEYYREALEDE